MDNKSVIASNTTGEKPYHMLLQVDTLYHQQKELGHKRDACMMMHVLCTLLSAKLDKGFWVGLKTYLGLVMSTQCC